MKLRKNKAFSLIELSVVLMIIGIMTSVVMGGGILLKNWRLNAARNITQGSPVASIKDLIFWFEPVMEKSFSTLIDNNAAVVNWYDNNNQSAIKLIATQPTSSKAPLYKANGIGGLPSLQFDGTDDVLFVSNIATTSANHTIFAVFNVDVGSFSATRDLFTLHYNFDNDFTDSDAGNGILVEITSAAILRFLHRTPMGGGGGDNNYSVATIRENNNYIFSSVRDFQATTMKVWLNNTLFVDGTVVTGGNFDYSNLSATIGGLNDAPGSRIFKGKISELIMYDRALSQKEVDDIEEYLSKKYQIKI